MSEVMVMIDLAAASHGTPTLGFKFVPSWGSSLGYRPADDFVKRVLSPDRTIARTRMACAHR